MTVDSDVEVLITDTEQAMRAHIDAAISAASKSKLLQGRLERDDDGHLSHQTIRSRHYLRVPIPDHRKALTRMPGRFFSGRSTVALR